MLLSVPIHGTQVWILTLFAVKSNGRVQGEQKFTYF